MDLIRHRCRWLAAVLAALMLVTTVAVPTASAGMIGTQALAADQAADDVRARVSAFLDRGDVKTQLESLGVDPAEAQQRVAALSDAEARQLAARMDEMPAGGNSLIGALVFIFVVLLITDILGLTNIFPFVTR